MKILLVKRAPWMVALMMIMAGAGAQEVSTAIETPFSKGVNLTGWFQAGSAGEVQYDKYSKQDFINIKSLGFDHIRLPINLHYMTEGANGDITEKANGDIMERAPGDITGGANDYPLDATFLEKLNQVADWAEELQLHLILDNHTFNPSVDTDREVEDVLHKVWAQMAGEFADRSGYIYYEILNEPHGIKDRVWNRIQGRVIETIREHDNRHYIVVGPAGWNSYNNLAAMPEYDDDKLIYTFHFYDPFLFTHQGASWNTPSMAEIENIPFPYDKDNMPVMQNSFAGTWVENLYNNYPRDGNAGKMKELMDIAVQFSKERQVPVFCGEFGVYQRTSDEADRIRWYEALVDIFDRVNMSWTMWDYHGGFGLFKEGSKGSFEHDLNIPLLKAMNLNVPGEY